jgi:hypothetical protein
MLVLVVMLALLHVLGLHALRVLLALCAGVAALGTRPLPCTMFSCQDQ